MISAAFLSFAVPPVCSQEMSADQDRAQSAAPANEMTPVVPDVPIDDPELSQNILSGVVTETFQLKYALPEEAVNKVRELMGASVGGVTIDEKTREIEVTAPPDLIERVRALISRLDIDIQIQFAAKVVQVDLSDEHRQGINWSAILSDYKNFLASEDSRQLSGGTVSTEDLDVLLEALETVGETEMFSDSRVTLNNGYTADLRLKAMDQDQQAQVILVPVKDTNPASQDRYSARLILTPSAIGAEQVDLKILSSDGTTTVITVKADSVAVIGGIFTQAKMQSTKKFPFLGDLPLLGAVFRGQRKEVHRLENIIILTPRVITPGTNR